MEKEYWYDSDFVHFNYSATIEPKYITKVIEENSGHTFFLPETLAEIQTKNSPFYLCGIKKYERSVNLNNPNNMGIIISILTYYRNLEFDTGIWVDGKENTLYIDVPKVIYSEDEAYENCVRENQIAVTYVLPNLKEAYVLYKA